MIIQFNRLWMLALAAIMLATPALAQNNSDGNVPVEITIEHRIELTFSGDNAMRANITKNDFSKAVEKIFPKMGTLTWDANVPWRIMVRRTKWTGPSGWDQTQDHLLRFKVRKANPPGTTGWVVAPQPDWAPWFESTDIGKAKKSGQIDYSIDWQLLPANKRVPGMYTATVSYTIVDTTI